MVGEGGVLPLPWLGASLREALTTQHAHALLVHGLAGVGQFEFSIVLAQAWLCESGEDAAAPRPCGRCVSCRLVNARTHPDLMVVLSPLVREQLGWGADEGEGGSESRSKAKPSKEVKVESIRAAVAFAQSSSSRGRAKVVVVFPAERMNAVSANTLLKTLEEPPGVTRFALACGAPDALLPTIRSRCQAVHLPLPDAAVAGDWLAAQGVPGQQVLLAAAGGAPLEALAWSRDGITAAAWAALPKRVAQGDSTALTGWPLPRVTEALQKLCHDAMLVASGTSPRYFPAESIAAGSDLQTLVAWSRRLSTASRQSEHPWNAGLMVESMVQDAQQSLRIL